MDYVEGAHDLKKRLKKLLLASRESADLRTVSKWIAEKFRSVALALRYCHSNGIIHFDVKPANILVDANDKPILSDLGFAKKKISDASPIVVGFTIFYAHPDLKQDYVRMSSRNRVRKEIAAKNFKEAWDIYAYGKSLLEMLALVEQEYPDGVLYDYTFVYLHLSACRMLDGRNMNQDETDRIRRKLKEEGEDLSVFKETWGELEAREFEHIKYSSFEEIVSDFHKLKFNDLFFGNVPEINSYYHKRVQSLHKEFLHLSASELKQSPNIPSSPD